MTSNSEMNRRIREVYAKDKSHTISLADNVRGGV
uniref:ORF44 n=1 Tax=Nitrosopumilaceae spindle-shaped virus TaxID=3065433 RepID=A0AAT9JAC1_9VIRU